MSALTWSVHGYQLLVAEVGQARSLHQLEFARYMHGSHRVVQQAAGGGGAGSGLDEVQALQVRRSKGWGGASGVPAAPWAGRP